MDTHVEDRWKYVVSVVPGETNEPAPFVTVYADGLPIAFLTLHDPAEKARRIVAAVNACAGIPTEELEHREYEQHIIETGREIGRLWRERDQLREALKFYANPEVYRPDSIGRVLDLTDVARAALAAAGGE